MLVTIDPRFQINYSSYYIQGLMYVVGNSSIHFGIIKDIRVNSIDDYRKGVAILVSNGDREKRLFIDTWDNDEIHSYYYRWSDLYAKINVRPQDAELRKLRVIGPSFGIQLWNPIKTLQKACVNYCKAKRAKGFLPSLKDYLLNYAYTFVRRVPMDMYERPCQEDSEYVFALNTLWYDERTDSTTNRYRGIFAKICQRVFVQFEGGFFYIPDSGVLTQFPKYQEYLDIYKGMLVTRRVGMREYLKKTRRSALVFNVPSVSGCHGWKLGEYLALGKAIVSIPLNNVMPQGWIAGETHLEVNNEIEMEQAICRLHEDPTLRFQLKQGAAEYFNQHLSPQSVILTLLSDLFQDEADSNSTCV